MVEAMLPPDSKILTSSIQEFPSAIMSFQPLWSTSAQVMVQRPPEPMLVR